jgi:serine protease Do
MKTLTFYKTLIVSSVVLTVGAVLLLLGGGLPFSHAEQRVVKQPPTEAHIHANALSDAFRFAADKAMPAIVTIQHRTEPQKVAVQRGERPRNEGRGEGRSQGELPDELLNDPFFRRFFEGVPDLPDLREMPRGGAQSAGSGVIIDRSGLVLTNNHVVTGGGKVTVRLTDGREYEATEVKTDPSTDIAIVRIKPEGNLPTAALGDSDQTRVGDWVLALGQPFGLANTVTAGIISAKGRGIGITDHEEFLQTDAAINPGNSGGPLVNLQGEVIGINTAISSTSGGYQGIGFAVPVNVVKWVVQQLQADGTVHRAYLGIGIQPVTQEIASQLGMDRPRGALVTDVRAGSPAEKAGVKVGDVVIDYAGVAVTEPRELSAVVARTKIGSQQPLRVIRDGKEQSLTVNVLEMPENFKSRKTLGGRTTAPEGISIKELGFEVAPLTAEKAEQLGLKGVHGLLIVSVEEDSLAADAGLDAGMVIERVGQTPVASVEDLQKAMKNVSMERGVLLLIRTTEGSRFVVIKKQ